MNKIFYVIFICLISTVCRADDQQSFVQANYLFEQQKYKQAYNLYATIAKKGFPVLYNMSLSCLYMDDYAHAVLYAKRAEKLANFTQLTLLYTLFDYMKSQVDPDYVPTIGEQISCFIRKCIISTPLLFLQLLLLISLLWWIIFWYNRWYQIYHNLLIYILLLIIVCGIVWRYKNDFIQEQIGIVMENQVTVFSGPDDSFDKKAELHKADEIIIIKKEKKYYQIRSKNSLGWIVDNKIEVV